VITPQTEHLAPSVSPPWVQVALTAGRTTALCPLAEISFCGTVTVLQIEHLIVPAVMKEDEAAGELIVTTQNNVYHCLLQYCCFEKQDEYPDVIPDYERIKEKYAGKID
jgi:hypothetical protein